MLLSSGQFAVIAKHSKSVRSIVVKIVVSQCSDPCCSPNAENLAVVHKGSKWVRRMQCATRHSVAEVLVVFVDSRQPPQSCVASFVVVVVAVVVVNLFGSQYVASQAFVRQTVRVLVSVLVKTVDVEANSVKK